MNDLSKLLLPEIISKMKGISLLCFVLLTIASVACANAQTVTTIPVPLKDKNKPQTPVGKPKAPSNMRVTMYCYVEENTLSFSFSESIDYLDVTVLNIKNGEITFSEVTHEHTSMTVNLNYGGIYSVSCIADNGNVFETEFEL